MPTRSADTFHELRQTLQSIPQQTYSPIRGIDDPILLPISSMTSAKMPDQRMVPDPQVVPDSQIMPDLDLTLDASFSWEMIGLGLEEPMPMQEAIDELYGL